MDSSIPVEPLIEESTIDPTTALPSLLEMILVDASVTTGRTVLRSSIEAAVVHASQIVGNSSVGSFRRQLFLSISRLGRSYAAEICFLITYFIESRRLCSRANASVAESLYALKRSKTSSVKNSSKVSIAPIQEADKVRSALILSLGPYLKQQADSLFQSERNRLHPQRLIEKLRFVFVSTYPFLHLILEGLQLAYNFSYLNGRSIYYCPSFHALGIVVRRVTMADIKQKKSVERRNDKITSPPFASSTGDQLNLVGKGETKHLKKAVVVGLLFAAGWLENLRNEIQRSRRRLIVREESLVTDESFSEQKSQGDDVQIPPPIPPRLLPLRPTGNQNQKVTQMDPSLCPLCNEKRLNPVASTSGYVFCYRCIALSLREKGERCPMTGMHCKESQLAFLNRSMSYVQV